jgi:hypothetical protein
MNINCKELAERYLLNQNPLYAFSFPLSILIAIIVFGCAKAFNWSNNSYIIQILIPILVLLLCMVIFDIISRNMVSKNDRDKLIAECSSWNKNNSLEKFSNINDAENINSKFVNIINDQMNQNMNIQSNNQPNKKMYDVVDPIAEIPNISPFPLESREIGNKCIQNSNCCSLCSGSNSNPCNIIAPIPGPQWIPQSAKSVQDRLVNNDYTESVCKFN